MSANNDDFQKAALHYHEYPKPGKLEVHSSKTLGSQRDLALAYSPGVAAPCLAIVEDPNKVVQYTAKGNLVGVITNGSAVLGLGDIGPLASKPVMEGKAVLFKKFADIDVFDLELNYKDIDSFVDNVASLEPTFGGINLEDIKAPECFEIERKLKERLKIPVFHDDQHGTAIIVCAAILNGLSLANKSLSEAKIVASGAGAAALACLNLLEKLGAKRENIWVTDIEGVVYKGREKLMDRYKEVYAQDTSARVLADVMDGADVFLGLSAAGVLKPELLSRMAKCPLILALANPVPEILPKEAKAVREDCMICTGRSDYPNQVNNVLCFPYIFRGALDVGAIAINDEMKIAAVNAIATLAREVVPDNKNLLLKNKRFGPGYLIPSPFDIRLLLRIAPAVAKAAMETGVALRPIEDMSVYIDKLHRFVYKSGLIMKPVFTASKAIKTKRVIYADGEDERVLRAAKSARDEDIVFPILVGRRDVILDRMEQIGISMQEDVDFAIKDPVNNPNYEEYVSLYISLAGRSGVTTEAAKRHVRNNTTVYSALALMRGDADGMICGLSGQFSKSLEIVEQIIGHDKDINKLAALSLLVFSNNILFMIDTQINHTLSAQEIAEITIQACQEIKWFGIEPKVALLSHSNFGSNDSESSLRMREAVNIIKRTNPEIQVDGEMHGDTALNAQLRERVYPHSTLDGEANLLVFPNLDSASITLNVVTQTANALHVGPILLGASRSVHIVTPSITSRGMLNMTAIAVLDASRKPLNKKI